MGRQALWFVVRDEDVDKVMAAVQALHLPPNEEAEVGGFLLAAPSMRLPGGGLLEAPTRPGHRLPGGGRAATLSGTGCSTTNWGEDGNCSDCGSDAQLVRFVFRPTPIGSTELSRDVGRSRVSVDPRRLTNRLRRGSIDTWRSAAMREAAS